MRRLLLRLTVTCNSGCAHCTMGDMEALPDRTTDSAVAELAAARRQGATELVFMRGEPTLRRDLPLLAARARALGYEHVQLQTNGRMLVYEPYLDQLVRAGMTFFEVSLFAPDAELHDEIGQAPGSFEQTVGGLKHLASRGLDHLVTIPVVKANVERLADTVRLVASLGLRFVQLNFTRPVLTPAGWTTHLVPTLTEASPHIREAIALAKELGLHADTEAVPLCHLALEDTSIEAMEKAGAAGETTTAFEDFHVVDLHREAPSMRVLREETRPEARECEGCRVREICPRTWAAYQELFGTSEFKAIR